MEITIRYATKEDAELIADISQQTFYDAFIKDNTEEDMQKFLTEQFTKGRLMLEVGSPENIFLLAYIGNEVAGYVKLREGKQPKELSTNNALEIARIYCTASCIGKGVGRALMQKCIEIAQERGKEIIWLGVWERNHHAIEFYAKWGFEKFGEQDFLLGNDLQNDWLMKKVL